MPQKKKKVSKSTAKSTGEVKDGSAPRTDSEFSTALDRICNRVYHLEYETTRQKLEHKVELEKLTSSFNIILALKNREIEDLKEKVGQLREEKEGEVGQLREEKKGKKKRNGILMGYGEDKENHGNNNDEEKKTDPKEDVEYFKAICYNTMVTTEMVSNWARSFDDCFQVKFDGISKLTASTLFRSKHLEQDGVNWQLWLLENNEHLSVTVIGSRLTHDCTLPSVEVRMFSKFYGDLDVVMTVNKTLALDRHSVFCCAKFLPLDHLFDEGMGYVKEDAVLVEVMFKPGSTHEPTCQ